MTTITTEQDDAGFRFLKSVGLANNEIKMENTKILAGIGLLSVTTTKEPLTYLGHIDAMELASFMHSLRYIETTNVTILDRFSNAGIEYVNIQIVLAANTELLLRV